MAAMGGTITGRQPRGARTMSEHATAAGPAREPILNPVDRVSEMLFGLFMALTFVGAVSVGDSGREQIRTMFIAALGCNLAWGLVDAVMYLVRSVADRGKWLTLVRSVQRAPHPEAGRATIAASLSQSAAGLLAAPELEAVRGRIAAMRDVPEHPRLNGQDLLAAVAIFLIVVAATFPVVLPFAFIDDVRTAKNLSRAIALAMLFGGGMVLGRYAGYGNWRVGIAMAGLGAVVVAAINALGG